jgi:hypothetical protein
LGVLVFFDVEADFDECAFPDADVEQV